MIFSNRKEAAKELSKVLSELIEDNENTIVIGIPRGGVILSYEIAKELGIKFSIVVVKKIPSPHDPELGIGAIAQDGTIVINDDLVLELGVGKLYIDEVVKRLKKEINKRLEFYGIEKSNLKKMKGKNVIIVDDGIATGATMEAAIRAIKKNKPRKIIVATPVAQKDVLEKLSKLVDKIVCINEVEMLGAVGMFYIDFAQVDDEEVKKLIESELFFG
ncbi:MAG: phosphoribosyltransferase [Candidatus Aenigmarchaeota archaeon]|nr:phosphoribosyltransferase [Candidatus Aenigmarchaeota archaeon]